MVSTGPSPAFFHLNQARECRMQTARERQRSTHRVGRFEFEIVADDRTPAVEHRWARRSEAITRWLRAEWEREQHRRMAERN
jgi:hypothetical protein